MTDRKRFLLFDSCVVVDFINADGDLFSLVSRFVGDVYFVDAMFPEVKDYLNIDTPEEIGLKLVKVDADDIIESLIRSEKSSLSVMDFFCFLTAKRNNWTCVTNDQRLRRECKRETIETLWGLQLVVELFRAGGINRDRARHIGMNIYKTNPWMTNNVLEQFFDILDEI